MTSLTESTVEDATLAWLEEFGYAVLHGPDIATGEPAAERSDPEYRDVVLEGRLRHALVALNRDLPTEALDEAYRKLTRIDAPSLAERNRALHRSVANRNTSRDNVSRSGQTSAIVGTPNAFGLGGCLFKRYPGVISDHDCIYMIDNDLPI